MLFLIESDYKPTIRNEIRAIVNQDDTVSQQQAEEAAMQIMIAYLQDRFDTSKIFPTIYEYDGSAEYHEGDIVYYDDHITPRIYTCIGTSIGNLPTDTDFFEARDPRNKMIILHLVNIVLFNMHSSCAPSHISEIRVKNYDDTINFLKRVADGKINPALPQYSNEEDSADAPRWGSNQKRTDGY